MRAKGHHYLKRAKVPDPIPNEFAELDKPLSEDEVLEDFARLPGMEGQFRRISPISQQTRELGEELTESMKGNIPMDDEMTRRLLLAKKALESGRIDHPGTPYPVADHFRHDLNPKLPPDFQDLLDGIREAYNAGDLAKAREMHTQVGDRLNAMDRATKTDPFARLRDSEPTGGKSLRPPGTIEALPGGGMLIYATREEIAARDKARAKSLPGPGQEEFFPGSGLIVWKER